LPARPFCKHLDRAASCPAADSSIMADCVGS
jgi:hypothetical protein